MHSAVKNAVLEKFKSRRSQRQLSEAYLSNSFSNHVCQSIYEVDALAKKINNYLIKTKKSKEYQILIFNMIK